MTETITRGMRFEHVYALDTDWTPGPGQKYADAPHAIMRVSRVTQTAVYYTADDGKGRFVIPRADLHKVARRWLED